MNHTQGNGFSRRDNRGNQGFPGPQKPWQQQRLKALAYQASAEENNEEGYGQRKELEPSQEENTETEASYFAGKDDQGNEIYHSTFDYSPSATKDCFAGFVGIKMYCHHCNETFPSKTKLHKHLPAGCDKVGKLLPYLADLMETETLDPPTPKIIKSNAPNQETRNGFGFRSWTYAMISVALDPSQKEDEVCVDSGTVVSLVDRAWALSKTSVAISKMAKPLRVRGFGSAIHKTSEYILHEIYFPGIDESGERVLAYVCRELHLVDDLRAKMLIGNNIIGPEGIVIDVANKKAYVASCGVTVRVSARLRGKFVKRRVHSNTATIVLPHLEIMLQTRSVNLPADRDFFSDPVAQTNLTLFAHLVDHTMTGVLVRNTTKLPIQVPKELRLGDVFKLEYKNCFQASVEPDFAMTHPKRMPPVVEAPSALSMPIFLNTATQTGKQETCLPNGVMIYGNTQETQALSNLVADFSQIWKDTGFVKVPEEEWMKIHLEDDWQSRVSGKTKVYPLGIKDWEVVDRTFDELQQQGRLEYTTLSTLFLYPVFVVWKTLASGEQKRRPVVDILGLNDLILCDVYPVPLQDEVIAMLVRCHYISVVDAISFFYQWRVHPDYRYMLTVVTHRGQETFNVPIIGCMNSIAYVQRQIDKILQGLAGAKAYVADIVTGAVTFSEHLQDLRWLFQLFVEYNITLSPGKAFLGYPDVKLLGRKVNSFGLILPEDKLRAISQLRYPTTLGALEHYLALTGYLREYFYFYSQIARPLQELKTRLLKDSPVASGQRKKYVSKTQLPQTTKLELVSFELLQTALSKLSILVHYDQNRTLWIDLDASKEFGFGVVVFHVKNETVADWPTRPDMEPIMFLSRLLTGVK